LAGSLTDDPRFGERDLEEEDFLDGTKVLDDTAVLPIGGEEHGTADDPSAGGEQKA
jgi:hypothetical protein